MNAAKTDQTDVTAIETLARFVAEAPPVESRLAQDRSRLALIDTIGCMLFGYTSPEAQIVRRTAAEWGSGDAVIVGGDAGLPAPWAALTNATAAHALDYDDWDDPSLTHTSAILFPTILAAMTDTGGSGRDIIDAHVYGVETLLRIGEAFNPSHYWKGWHATSTIGAIGCAASAARVFGLDTAQTANALSLATSMAGGFVSQFGAMAKPIHAGLAAKSGIVAASLARNGATGSWDTLSGRTSFRTLMSDAAPEALTRAFLKLGDPWAIEEHGLHTKLYPSCGGTHRIIDACLKIVADHAPDPNQIARVTLNVPQFLETLLPYGVPANRNEALFSIPYCAAVALVRGRVGIDEFDDAAITDPVLRDFTSRMTLETRDVEYVTKFCVPGDYDRVTVHMSDGRVLEHGIDIPLGAPPNFAPAEVVEKKFRDCARRRVSPQQSEALLSLLTAPLESWSYGDLLSLLRAD